MKLAGVTILYYPDEEFLKRIDSYRPYLNKLIIIDNSDRADPNIFLPLQNEDKICIIQNQENEGIAKRLNEAAKIAINEGYEWLLTMDQDSLFSAGDFNKYLQCIEEYTQKAKVALFAVEYDLRLLKKDVCSFIKVHYTITSGCILNLSVWQQTGGFNELLFIDSVDHEYCFNCIIYGYEIVKFDSIILSHQLGTAADLRSLRNFKKTKRFLHSPFRIYYMVRNYLYVNKKYSATFESDLKKIKKAVFNNIKNNLLYNKKRWIVLKYAIKGVTDFKRKRTGKSNLS